MSSKIQVLEHDQCDSVTEELVVTKKTSKQTIESTSWGGDLNGTNMEADHQGCSSFRKHDLGRVSMINVSMKSDQC